MRKTLSLILSAYVISFLFTGIGFAAWESRGIGGGGGLFSASISPHDSQQIYMTTDMSSVFFSENFGRSWETVDFRELRGGHDSAVNFTSDPQILYAVNIPDDLDYGVPVASRDSGKSWTPLAGDPTGGEAWSLYADPNSTDRLLVSSYEALYFSGNGGGSFTEVYRGSDLHIAGVFWDGTEIRVGTQEGLLVSTDSGASFTKSSVGGIGAGEFMASFSGAKENGVTRFFAVTLDSLWPGMSASDKLWASPRAYRLNVGDAAWTLVSGDIPTENGAYIVATAANDIDTAYLAGGNTATSAPVVFKTEDGGESWQAVFKTENNENIATGWCGAGGDEQWWFPEYALDFSVCPKDSTRAIITDLGYVHVTDNGGASWRQAYVDAEGENPASAPTPKGKSYRGIGLQQTSCWWLHWADKDTLIAAFTDISGMRSTDGGERWAAGSSLGLTHNTTYHIVEQGGTLYGATSSVHDMYESTFLADSRIDSGEGTVVASTDRGTQWSVIKDFSHPVIWLAKDPADSNTLYASVIHSTEGGIFVTRELSRGTDAGWTRLNTPPRTEGHPFNIHILNNGSILTTWSGRRDASGVFTESSGVFLSEDQGATWQDLSDAGMRRWTKDLIVDPGDPSQNTWYVTVFSHWGTNDNEVGGLYRTIDRGKSWNRISDLYRVESVALDPGAADTLYLATEQQGLWKTENLSAPSPVFNQVEDYPFKNPTRIFFNPFDPEEIWVTSFGGGMRVKRKTDSPPDPPPVQSPVPGIRINGKEGGATAEQGEAFTLGISLSGGDFVGTEGDWWLVMAAPDGKLHHLSAATLSMVPGVAPTLQAPLMDLSETPLPGMSLETQGSHTFYFGVDTHMNGAVDGDIYYKSVEITVTAPEAENPVTGPGFVTYSLDNRVYRIEASAGALPEDVSTALGLLSPGTEDSQLNTSPDGSFLVLQTDRFDPECSDWACLALVKGDLSEAGVIRASGQVIHPEGWSAVSSDGRLIVFTGRGETTHALDLWVIRKTGDDWGAPISLTSGAAYAWNGFPSIAPAGDRVVFNCAAESFNAPGSAICEVNTDGTGFRTVIKAEDNPLGTGPGSNPLHSPGYEPDGSILFEADWFGEQFWRLGPGETIPVRVTDRFNNDNTPCVLRDGRIAGLWLDRPGASGFHELKIMDADGKNEVMLLLDRDISDIGIGCGQK